MVVYYDDRPTLIHRASSTIDSAVSWQLLPVKVLNFAKNVDEPSFNIATSLVVIAGISVVYLKSTAEPFGLSETEHPSIDAASF